MLESNEKNIKIMDIEQFKKIRRGQTVYVRCNKKIIKSTALDDAFYNVGSLFPDWEVETTVGFVHADSAVVID